MWVTVLGIGELASPGFSGFLSTEGEKKNQAEPDSGVSEEALIPFNVEKH